MSKTLAGLLAVCVMGVASAADPPGLSVAASDPQVEQITGNVSCAEGRFVPLNLAPGKPSLLMGNKAGYMTVYPLAPGEAVHGIRYDEPAGAKTKRYTFPKGANYYAVANTLPPGVAPATVTLTAIVNGKTDADAPTVAGELVVTLTGSKPPPGPKPPDPVDPPDLTAFQIKLQDAYHVDVATKGATAEHKSKYAALWRNAAKTTVYDTTIATPAALLKEMNAAVKNLGIPPGSLDNTARAVADEINPLMPKPSDGTMSKAVRDSVSALFTRISNDLEVIK